MAGTTFAPQVLTPLSDAQGGTIPAGLLQQSVDKFFRALGKRKTMFLDKIPMTTGGNQVKEEWGQRYFRPLTLTSAAQQASGDTTLTLATGQGKLLQQYMVLRAIDATNGDEVEWLSGPPPATGDVLTNLKRAQGTTSAVTHATGMTFEIIGVAEPYGVDHVISPVYKGAMVNNRYQRFSGSINADKAELVTPNWEDVAPKKMAQLIREEAGHQKILLQKAILYGSKQTADNSTTPKTPGMLGGWREYVTSHVVDLKNLPISVYDVDDLASAAWLDAKDDTATVLCMGPAVKKAFARKTVPYRDSLNMDSRSVDFRLESIMLDVVGEVKFMVIEDFPPGELWGVNFDMLEVKSYEGLGWHFMPMPAYGEYEWEAVSGDFTFKVNGEASQFRIKNIGTNLQLYPKGRW